MSRSPNIEQKPAIEHLGGKLLSAGAGSGKTFVLIEHIKFLTLKWGEEWRNGSKLQSLKDFLAEKYSGVVLMTFTRLAAGEINVRLNDQISVLAEMSDSSDHAIWVASKDSLEYLTVTTIDGFFYKLVKLGYFPDISSDTSIIMFETKRKMILDKFEEWWEANLDKIPSDYQRDSSIHRKNLSESFVKIMSDPSLRSAWLAFEVDDVSPENLDYMVKTVEALNGWNEFIRRSVEIPDEARKNKWAIVAEKLNARRNNIESWDDLIDWYHFCSSDEAQVVRRFGNHKHLVEEYFEKYLSFKESVNEWGDHYLHYRENFNEKIKPWLKILKEIIQWLDQSLDTSQGMTYGDLEFEVLKNLKNESIRRRVAKDFKYFIVDEFQDTSLIQYDALLLLSLNKTDRLFCVGDIKQAIYGFRGGELAVFQTLSKALGEENNLKMSANYRSEKTIIDFNNKIFTMLFPLSNEWRGKDPFSVEMTTQTYPHQDEEQRGQVIELECELPDVVRVRPDYANKKTPKWRLKDLDALEAKAFADYIYKKLQTEPEASIAVLYRKLEPSKLLISELIRLGIGFTSQAKIPFGKDPLSGILLSLIQDNLSEKNTEWSTYMVTAYLSILGFKSLGDVKRACFLFNNDLKIYGISVAFNLFLERLHLSNSLPDGNLQALHELMAISLNDIETIYQRLKAKADISWSANFRYGENSQRVVIQSAHASKGLEYDVVLLGGAYSNGTAMGDRSWAGSFPGSAVWIEDPLLRESKKTLSFHFENLIERHKAFSESKRLLYVACTRAKKELIIFRSFSLNDQLKLDDKSWAKALDLFLNSSSFSTLKIKSTIPIEKIEAQTDSKPFFHSNNLGLLEKILAPNKRFGLTPELSATKLNSLINCPRQFYYKAVLKIDEPDSVAWGDEQFSETPTSSSQRGSDIHLALAQAVEHNFVVPLVYQNHAYKDQIEWTLAQLRALKGSLPKSEFICERPLKFPFFGFMLSGIPDLVIRDSRTQIWDYKTGRRKPETEKKYWQQLMIYAYAFWSIKTVSLDFEIKLTLCYIDEKLILDKTVSWGDVSQELFQMWSRLEDLSVANTQSCPLCPYKEICPA